MNGDSEGYVPLLQGHFEDGGRAGRIPPRHDSSVYILSDSGVK